MRPHRTSRQNFGRAGQMAATKARTGKAETAYRRLRRAVESGRLDPAARLTEAKACEVAGTSRGPVREAMLKLEGERLLSSKGHSRGRVVLHMEDQSREELVHRYELREIVEVGVARLAARNMSAREVDGFRQIAQRAVEAHEAGDRHRTYDLCGDYREYLIDHCGNPLISQLWEAYALEPARPRSAALEEKISAAVPEGKDSEWSPLALADAINARDADRAEHIVRDKVAHIIKVLRTIDWREVARDQD